MDYSYKLGVQYYKGLKSSLKFYKG